jgi:hypothetical protein
LTKNASTSDCIVLNWEFLSAKEFHVASGNSDSVAPAGLGYKAFIFFSELL